MTSKKIASLNGSKLKLSNNIIPKMFEDEKVFVCYDKDKKPYNAITKKLASSTNPNDWVTYQVALDSLKITSKFKGIGVVLGKTSKGNLCGIDIDNCIDENGNISKEAQEIIKLFNSYTELSISGRGIHILFFATKKGNHCKINNLDWCKSLELYDKNRYFTLTGNFINDKPIQYRQKECDIIYNKYFHKIDNIHTNHQTSTNLTPFTAKQAMDNCKDFQFALEKDKTLYNYWNGIRKTKNESSNDSGFCRKLAYYLKKDYLIKIYFISSPYFNQKDIYHKYKCLIRKDYLDRTIDFVLGRIPNE